MYALSQARGKHATSMNMKSEAEVRATHRDEGGRARRVPGAQVFATHSVLTFGIDFMSGAVFRFPPSVRATLSRSPAAPHRGRTAPAERSGVAVLAAETARNVRKRNRLLPAWLLEKGARFTGRAKCSHAVSATPREPTSTPSSPTSEPKSPRSTHECDGRDRGSRPSAIAAVACRRVRGRRIILLRSGWGGADACPVQSQYGIN